MTCIGWMEHRSFLENIFPCIKSESAQKYDEGIVKMRRINNAEDVKESEDNLECTIIKVIAVFFIVLGIICALILA